MAIAPDALTPLGGYPGDEEKARELFPKLDQPKVREDFIACANYIRTRSDCTGKIGAVGFCYGGGVVSMLAARLGADLAAGVPFYGGQPTAEDTARIKAAMLINYAGTDERINAGWPAWEAALKANNVRYEGYIYAMVTDTSTSLSGWQLTGTTSAGLWPRGVDIWTEDTEDTGTTAWIKGLRVLSLSSVTPWTVDKSLHVSPRKCSPALPWCLVPNIAGICSAEKAPERHRLPAARQGLTLAIQSGSTRAQQGNMGERSQLKAEYRRRDPVATR